MSSSVKIERFKAFKDYQDFYSIPQLLCLSIGIDITQRYPRRKLLLFLLVLCQCCLHFYMFLRLIKLFISEIKRGDIAYIILIACYQSYQIDAVYKFLSLLHHRKRLQKLYEYLQENYPATSAEHEVYEVDENHASSSRSLLFACNYISNLGIILEPLLESFLNYIYQRLASDEELHFMYLKPFPIDHPYDHRSPGFYTFFYIAEVIQSCFMINTVFGIDLWLIALTNQTCLHFRYIAKSLENYKPSERNESKDCEFLERLVKRHQTILKTISDLNAIFGATLLSNLMFTGFLVCFVCVQLTIMDFGMAYMTYGFFVVTTICKLFIVCNYGNQLIITSTDIGEAAYRSAWYEGSQRYKKQLLLMITRSQAQTELSAKGFQTISLTTFQSVLSMSYKLFTLLRSTVQ